MEGEGAITVVTPLAQQTGVPAVVVER